MSMALTVLEKQELEPGCNLAFSKLNVSETAK